MKLVQSSLNDRLPGDGVRKQKFETVDHKMFYATIGFPCPEDAKKDQISTWVNREFNYKRL
jgi:hypothetical protein